MSTIPELITNEEILTLSREGWQPSQIAKKLGCPVQLVYVRRAQAVEDWRRNNKHLTSEYITVNFLRLEDLWGQVTKRLGEEDAKDVKTFASLVATALSVMDRQTRLLGINKEGSSSPGKALWSGLSQKPERPPQPFGLAKETAAIT